MVACVAPEAEQLVSDGDALALIVDVADNTEQVSPIDAGRQHPPATLDIEDGDALDDGIEGVARDRDAEVLLGIEQIVTREGLVNEGAGDGVLARLPRQAREQLLAASVQSGADRGAGCALGRVSSSPSQPEKAVEGNSTLVV